jgi:hypothetical protein
MHFDLEVTLLKHAADEGIAVELGPGPRLRTRERFVVDDQDEPTRIARHFVCSLRQNKRSRRIVGD